MAYALPADVDERPVVIDGAGTLGRRIAAVYSAGGSDVRIFDPSAEQREAARNYVEEHLAETQQTLGLHPAPTRAGRGLRRPAGGRRRRLDGDRGCAREDRPQDRDRR